MASTSFIDESIRVMLAAEEATERIEEALDIDPTE
jgi:hypothetical protein